MKSRTSTRLTHPVRALLVGYGIAFVAPWSVWGTLIAEQHGLIGWHLPQSLAFWVGLPLAVIAAALAGGGWAGLSQVVARLLRWRTSWRWYTTAVLLAAGLPLFVLFVARTAEIPQPSEVLPRGSVPISLLIETVMFWLTEEAMWRGFAQPTFRRWLNPAVASVVVGLLWALWHLPLFAIRGSFQSSSPISASSCSPSPRRSSWAGCSLDPAAPW